MYNSICKLITASSLAFVNDWLNLVTSGTHTHTVTLTHRHDTAAASCHMLTLTHLAPLEPLSLPLPPLLLLQLLLPYAALMQFWACAKLNYQFALFISRTYFICAVAIAVAAAAADSDSIALTLPLLAVLFFCPLSLLTALPLSLTLLLPLPLPTTLFLCPLSLPTLTPSS